MAAIAQQPERITQGFVANLSWLRARPLLTLIEVAWRWAFGIPALWLLYTQGMRVLNAVPWRATGVEGVTVNQLLTDPMGASTTIANFAAVVGPDVYAAAAWIVPLLLVVWTVVSGVGRTLLLRRMDGTLHARPATLVVLQLLRVLPLAAVFAAWWFGLQKLAQHTVLTGGEPQMMVYVGGVIILTIGLFVFSAAIGWIFSIAPLLAMLHNTNAVRSLRDALQVGHLRAALVEINLVLGIVKIALVVLAMVFSACPLPFQSVMTDEFLFWWNVGVAIWYFIASDFFHVARLSSYLRLWRATHSE